tara:strand:+ start:5404 stop:6111 length:708 start_codon:yes stop_codon:yes gene_type:complete
MALPQINDIPKYNLTIPSTGQEVTFKPFLVKEQKILLIALESGDDKQILRSIIDTVTSCILDKINVEKLATFDLEYIFTQIRSKSAGESTKLNLLCSKCEEVTPTVVNLEEISINVDVKDKIIELTDKFTLVMRYPNYKGVLLNMNGDDDSVTNAIFEMIVMCLDELRTEEEIIKFDDETRESIDAFVGGLTASQIEFIVNFVESLPKLEHDITFNCTHCNTVNEIKLQGLQDFF